MTLTNSVLSLFVILVINSSKNSIQNNILFFQEVGESDSNEYDIGMCIADEAMNYEMSPILSSR